MRTSIATVLILALFIPVPAADAPLAKELADVQGVWKLVAGENQGQPLEMDRNAVLWAIEGNKIRYGGSDLAEITLDNTKKPWTVDLTFVNPKRTLVGIYERDGDILRVCVNIQDGAKKRPTTLATVRQPQNRLLFFQRVKGEKIDPVAGMRGFLGVSLGNNEQNVVISNVVKDAPADKAGVKDGDVILKLNGKEMKTSEDVIEGMREIKPTSMVSLVIRREGKEKVVEVKAGTFPFSVLD
jgi:uncharacterized protein (TIGR03067 family)